MEPSILAEWIKSPTAWNPQSSKLTEGNKSPSPWNYKPSFQDNWSPEPRRTMAVKKIIRRGNEKMVRGKSFVIRMG